jgi:ATP-dependent DNA helicase RecG
MIEVCREAGLPEPEFAELSGAFVVTFRKSRLTKEYLEGLGLSPRQIVAVEYLRTRGRITKWEYVEVTGASARTAVDELRTLVDKGLLVPTGQGRVRHYRLQLPA